MPAYPNYRQISNIRRVLVGNTFVDHSDVVGAAPVFIFDLISVFNILRKDHGKTRLETIQFWDVVSLILEIWRYVD